jgi:enamine deaminase RidA (YjgF/YER057c/UK114 family)
MNRRLYLLCVALLVLSSCASVGPQPQHACFHRSESIETDIGYCQALRVGNTLYISGIAGQGDMSSAIRSVYERLRQVLEANGLSFANVAKETVFATDLDAFIRNKDMRKKFYGESLPAATWVQVERLYLPSFVVEIELTAEYPK